MVSVCPEPSDHSPTVKLVRFEVPSVAVSIFVLGTVAGIQLAAVFQSLLTGFELHLALPANVAGAMIATARIVSNLFAVVFILSKLIVNRLPNERAKPRRAAGETRGGNRLRTQFNYMLRYPVKN